jgi:hypothetical protein
MKYTYAVGHIGGWGTEYQIVDESNDLVCVAFTEKVARRIVKTLNTMELAETVMKDFRTSALRDKTPPYSDIVSLVKESIAKAT